MNKKLLPILIVTTFSLTACNESKQHQTPSDSTTAYKNLSIANLADIKADLDALDQISNKNSQAILNAQDALKAARQNKEVDTIPALLEQLKTHSLAFNTALDATNFKSSEVAALSEKFKQVHLLGVELAQENTKSPAVHCMNCNFIFRSAKIWLNTPCAQASAIAKLASKNNAKFRLFKNLVAR